MKPQLIQTLTPSISTFLIGLNSYKKGHVLLNLILNNFLSRVDIQTRSGELYHAYKIFVKDCCELAEKSDRKAYQVVNEIVINIQ